jgi:site-specific recombinase XerD
LVTQAVVMSDSAVVVVVQDPSVAAERMAVAAFLAGYVGSTRRGYATDLRLFAGWCREAQVTLFTVRRAHIELFGRWMEENGRMRSTVGRRLSTLASFYRYCEQEQLIERNPALNVRRPKVDYESRTLGLDRNELGAFLVQAGLGSSRDHALASLLALNGLRISEAMGADVEDLDFDRGHRTLRIVRKGGRHAVVPLAPRTSRAIDLYLGGTNHRAAVRVGSRAAHGSLRRRSDGQAAGPTSRDHQADLAPQPAPLVHHRRPRRRRRPAGRARGGQPRRPPHHHAL